MKQRIVVAGSVNQDLIITVPRLPKLGETIIGSGFASASGGKGANQAVAAARLGGRVTLAAAIGDDEPGRRMKADFIADGIDVSFIESIPGTPTGTAVITLCGGDNCIVIDRGANQEVTPALIDKAESVIAGAGLLLLQMEIPFGSVTHAIGLAKKHGVAVLLNPAPAAPLEDDLYKQIDILTPNESECGILTGMEINSPTDAKQAVSILTRRGVRRVIVTMGAQGAVYNDGEQVYHTPALACTAVDTTAAGDCFTAAIAVALMEGASIHDAVRFACAAATLAVTRKGAQPSLPYRAEADAVLHRGAI